MQITIIIGVWFALLTGSMGAYVFLIVLKTAIDVAFQASPNLIRDAVTKTC